MGEVEIALTGISGVCAFLYDFRPPFMDFWTTSHKLLNGFAPRNVQPI